MPSQMLLPRQPSPLFLRLSSCIVPLSAYALHKRHDSRTISEEEVTRSRNALRRLLPPPPPPRPVASLSDNGNATDAAYEAARSRNFLRRFLPLPAPRSAAISHDDAADREHRNRHQLDHLVHKGGVTLLPNILDANAIKTWKENFNNAFSDHPKNLLNNRGRMHSHQETAKSSPYHSHFLTLASSLLELQSLVRSYFVHYNVKNYKLTQIQFLLAKPGCEHQIWHRDNIAPGLTLLIALEDVHSNGPTELLPGTHLDRTATQLAFHTRNEDDTGDDGDKTTTATEGAMLACLTAGDAVLYDARVLHRGRGYDASVEEERPVLVLRWDALVTPPPGAGIIVTNVNDCAASVRMFLGEVRGVVRWLMPSGLDNRKDEER